MSKLAEGPATLESRFTRFLEGLPGTESIDRFALPDDPQHRRKADFLLANRNVLVELKTLTEDPSHKVEATVDKHRGREDWPLFYGTANVRKVLSNLPDGESIYGKMVNALGRSVETAVRSAEEQVTHTRRVLGLPNAAGLLVILNDSIDVPAIASRNSCAAHERATAKLRKWTSPGCCSRAMPWEWFRAVRPFPVF